MANLIEDVLDIIFGKLTPLEWVQISRVCTFWKQVVEKQFKKLSALTYPDISSGYSFISRIVMFELYKIECTKAEQDAAPVLSAKDAKAILVCAAPHIKVFKTGLAYVKGSENLLMLGRFLYKVKGLIPDRTSILLVQNADELTEVIFEDSPQLIRNFNEKCKIKKVTILNDIRSRTGIPNTIEELTAGIGRAAYTPNLRFPVLKKLDLFLFDGGTYLSTVNQPQFIRKLSDVLREKLSRVLPHVLGVKSLRLFFDSNRQVSIPLKNLLEQLLYITEMAQLEELCLESEEMKITSNGADVFVNKLTTGCKHLRKAKIGMVEIEENDLCKMLKMSHLENLEVGITRFDSMILANPINLSELRLHYNKHKFNVLTFCKVLVNLPKLQFLGMYEINPLICDSDDTKSLEMVYKSTVAVLSQDKKVTIANSQHFSKLSDRKLTFKNKQYYELDSQIPSLYFELNCRNFTVFCQKLTPYLKDYFCEYS